MFKLKEKILGKELAERLDRKRIAREIANDVAEELKQLGYDAKVEKINKFPYAKIITNAPNELKDKITEEVKQRYIVELEAIRAKLRLKLRI